MAFKTSRMRQTRLKHLVEAMKAVEVGEQITHEQLAAVVRLEECPNELFQRALVIGNRESGIYFQSVRGIGYVRVPPTEWEGIHDKYRTRGRRQFSRGRKFVTNVVAKTNELSDDEQRKASRAIGLMQTIESMARRIAGT